MLKMIMMALAGALLGGIAGYFMLFSFTAVTGLWFVLLDIVLGIAVAAGMLLLARDDCDQNLLLFQFIGGFISLLTVAIAEYEINRFMFARTREIDIANFSVIPNSLQMYFDIAISTTWWQPLIGAALAVFASVRLLRDWVR